MPDEPREALITLVNRLTAAPHSERSPLVLQILPLLGDLRLPVPVRVVAAAHVLRFVPDRDRPVRRVAHALTRGLTSSRRLVRLRHLQHHVEKCDALDEFLDHCEQRVKLACPRCSVRLPRVEMVKHLWHEHGLILDRGKTRSTERIAGEFQEQHAMTGDPEPLDRVTALAGIAGLRKWLATDNAPPDEIAPLLQAAGEHGAGLCPGCFAEIPAAVVSLPEPLGLARGRLSGESYAIAVGGNAWFQTQRVTTPEQPTAVSGRSLAPRAVATFAATAVMLGVLLVARTFSAAIVGLAVAAIVYAVMRFLRSDAESLDVQAVNAAWARLVPRLAERENAARFLTRLCLASYGRGDPEARALVLNAIVARAAASANDLDAELQLLAAARVLQIEDVARYGRDVVAGIAALAADGFVGMVPADYAELAIGCYLVKNRDPGDLARLRVLLIGAAFEAGLVPRDLIDLWAGAPHLRRAMAVEPTHRLGLLFGLWRTRTEVSWESVAPADTVFELARTSPPTAARVLARYPDLLLYHRPDPAIEDLVGPVMVCSRGVAVAGLLTADPDAEVRLSSDDRVLIFGRHRIEVPRRLPDEFPELLTNWLRYRANVLLPFIDGYLSAGSAEVSRRVLGPFCRSCRTCGTVSAVTRGEFGQRPKGL